MQKNKILLWLHSRVLTPCTCCLRTFSPLFFLLNYSYKGSPLGLYYRQELAGLNLPREITGQAAEEVCI